MPFHQVKVGDYEIIAIQSMTDRVVDPAGFFPTASPEFFESAFREAPRYFGDSAQALKFTQNLCVVKTPSKTILVDTGIPVSEPDALLTSGLAEAGIAPEDIGFVILTHRDRDHVGGNMRDGMPAYPNARYVIGRSEYEGFKAETSREELIAQTMIPLEAAGVLDVVADDAEIADGVRLWLTPGHRGAATSVLVGNEALLLADVWHAFFQVPRPDLSIQFDSDPALAAVTREAAVDRAQRENLLVAVPHTPFFGLGRVSNRMWLPVI